MTTLLLSSGGSQNSFDPLEFYELAKSLAQTTSDAALRTAVGRAYYAMFLLAANRPSVVALLPSDTTGEGPHDIVFKTIKQQLKQRAIADMLWELKRLRKEADYHTSASEPYFQNWSKNWQRAQKLVEWLLPMLQTL